MVRLPRLGRTARLVIALATAVIASPAPAQVSGLMITSVTNGVYSIRIAPLPPNSYVLFLRLPAAGVEEAALARPARALQAGCTITHVGRADAGGAYEVSFLATNMAPGAAFAAYAQPSAGWTYLGTLRPGAEALAEPVGVFITRGDLERARERIDGGVEPYASGAAQHRARANGFLDDDADPFHMNDVSTIKFGWCSDNDGIDNSLSDATKQIETGSDKFRCLALEYALGSGAAYGDKALEMMLDWAAEGTIVNSYDFNPNFQAGSIDGMTSGFCSFRPWNFALSTIWNTYGLINAADSYLLLKRNGYAISPADDALLRAWIRELAESVNSGFHAWCRWADHHPNSASFERYRSDNHLSWGLAGLFSAAVALDDDELAAYVLDGGAWFDSHAGIAYTNPASIRDLIDRSIEPGGRIYEEKILRDPPIGYALFHLWAMSLVARTAQVHAGVDLWNVRGPDGAGMQDAFNRYSAHILGENPGPAPELEGDLTFYAWEYEMAFGVWPSERFVDVIDTTNRLTHRAQSIGPIALLVGEDLGDLPPPDPTCLSGTASWQNTALGSTQSGTFAVEYDLTPDASTTNSIVALSNGPGAGFADFAVLVRSFEGRFDARNGGAYAADSVVTYAAGQTYRFRVEVNVAAHTYSVFVTPPGGAAVRIADSYAFRTEQGAVAALTHWGLWSTQSVCDFTLNP